MSSEPALSAVHGPARPHHRRSHWLRLSVWSLACLTGVAALSLSGCRTSGSSSAPAQARNLPAPLPIADTTLELHVAAPRALVDELHAWAPDLLPLSTLAARVLAKAAPESIATLALPLLDGDRAWSIAQLTDDDGQPVMVVVLPLKQDDADALEALTLQLEAMPALGEHGGHTLDTDPSGLVTAARYDAASNTLVLGRSERSLFSAGALQQHFAGTPLRARVDAGWLDPAAAGVAIDLRGRALDDLSVDIDLEGAASQLAVALELLAPGVLGGLVDAPGPALAATARFSGAARVQKEVTAEITGRVNAQNFLVRGVIEDMAKQANAIIRAWDGRAAAGVLEGGHVLVAAGVNAPSATTGTLARLIDEVNSNAQLASTFGAKLPSISHNKRAATAAGAAIGSVAVSGVGKYLPPMLKGLLTDQGKLVVAYFPIDAHGAAAVVAGPNAVETATTWLERAAAQPASGADELAALSWRITPEAVTAAWTTRTIEPLLSTPPDARAWQVRARKTERGVAVTVARETK